MIEPAGNHSVNNTVQQFVFSQFPTVSPVVAFFVTIVFTLLAAKAVQVVGAQVARRLLSRTDSEIDDIAFEEAHAPIYLTVALTGVYVASMLLTLTPEINFYLRGIVLSLIILIWTRAFVRGGNRFFEHVKKADKRYEFAHIFDNIWTFVVIIVATFTLLTIWKIDVTPLLASAGVAGVVIGFAAKDAVANLFGGIALYFDDTYKVGDYIVLDSGDSGTVVDIGIRSTTIITRDDVTVTIPNSVLNSSKVINESSPKERKRITVPIGIAYGSDIDRFEEIILEIAEEEDMVLGHPSPRMRFSEFGDFSLNYDLLCWVEAPLKDRRAQHELNREIYKRLNAEGIEIPFPKRDIYMRQTAAEQARKQEQEQVEEQVEEHVEER